MPHRNTSLFKISGWAGPAKPLVVFPSSATPYTNSTQISTVFFRDPKPDWLSMERQAIPLNTIDYLLWCDTKSRPAIMSPTLSHSIALCSKLYSRHYLISPIKALQWWTDKGLYRIGHFLSPAGPLTLSHCRKKLEMPDLELFSFSQISHFLQSIWTNKTEPPTITP